MAFQGSLKELPLPDIIQLVSVSGKTGVFTLRNGADSGEIFLRKGQIAHATVGALALIIHRYASFFASTSTSRTRWAPAGTALHGASDCRVGGLATKDAPCTLAAASVRTGASISTTCVSRQRVRTAEVSPRSRRAATTPTSSTSTT